MWPPHRARHPTPLQNLHSLIKQSQPATISQCSAPLKTGGDLTPLEYRANSIRAPISLIRCSLGTGNGNRRWEAGTAAQLRILSSGRQRCSQAQSAESIASDPYPPTLLEWPAAPRAQAQASKEPQPAATTRPDLELPCSVSCSTSPDTSV